MGQSHFIWLFWWIMGLRDSSGSSFLVFSLNNHPQGPYIATQPSGNNIDSPVQIQISQWTHLVFTYSNSIAIKWNNDLVRFHQTLIITASNPYLICFQFDLKQMYSKVPGVFFSKFKSYLPGKIWKLFWNILNLFREKS